MISKRVARRSALAENVASAAEEWSAAARERLEQILGPYLADGESIPDFQLAQELLGRLVADHGKKLEASGRLLQGSLLDAKYLRLRRDEAAEKLRCLLRGARFYFDQVHGRGTGKQRGLGHGLSRTPMLELWRIARGTGIALESEKPRAATASLPDPAVLGAEILAQAAELGALLDRLAPQRSRADVARDLQGQGIRETERLVRCSAKLLSAIYELAELTGLAKAVRPRFRRPRRRKAKKAPAIAPASSSSTASPSVPDDPANLQTWVSDLDWSEVRPAEEPDGTRFSPPRE